MAILWKAGEGMRKWLPVTTSTAITKNTLVTQTSGLLVAATAGTTAANILGVLDKTIASTDSDYATARTVPVWIPQDRFALFECDVTSGLVVGDIGTEVDLTDGATVNRGASSIKAVRVVSVLSTTKGLFWIKFQGSY